VGVESERVEREREKRIGKGRDGKRQTEQTD
jgi:hypothetical protein